MAGKRMCDVLASYLDPGVRSSPGSTADLPRQDYVTARFQASVADPLRMSDPNQFLSITKTNIVLFFITRQT